MNLNFIIEDGYNTDYITSLLVAIFYFCSNELGTILGTDTNNPNTYYIQEFIKKKFVTQMHQNCSINSRTINRLRLFLYDSGWYKKCTFLLDRCKVNIFYEFLFSSILEYNIDFIRVDLASGKECDLQYPYIHIDDKFISEPKNQIVDTNSLISAWINLNVSENNKFAYKFKQVQILLPIYFDLRSKETHENKRYVNVMSAINFTEINDNVQNTFVWNVHSLICQNNKEEYYAIIHNDRDDWFAISDKFVPSVVQLNMADITTVRQIMKEVIFVFYSL